MTWEESKRGLILQDLKSGWRFGYHPHPEINLCSCRITMQKFQILAGQSWVLLAKTHMTTRIIGTDGYAAPKYVAAGNMISLRNLET